MLKIVPGIVSAQDMFALTILDLDKISFVLVKVQLGLEAVNFQYSIFPELNIFSSEVLAFSIDYRV